MRIRSGTLEDREFVVGLAARFAESELPPWRPAAMVVDGTASRLEAALRTPVSGSELLVAEDGGEALGFAWLLLVEDFFTRAPYCKISEIATVRDGTGAGTALMLAAEDWARERGCDMVMLNVLRGNAHARGFYEKLGYEPEYTAMAKPLPRQAPDPSG